MSQGPFSCLIPVHYFTCNHLSLLHEPGLFREAFFSLEKLTHLAIQGPHSCKCQKLLLAFITEERKLQLNGIYR